jgi:hypothetical protein
VETGLPSLSDHRAETGLWLLLYAPAQMNRQMNATTSASSTGFHSLGLLSFQAPPTPAPYGSRDRIKGNGVIETDEFYNIDSRSFRFENF